MIIQHINVISRTFSVRTDIVSGRMYHAKECMSCRISLGEEVVDGGTIPLGLHWMVNHYRCTEQRFLGWLIVQPNTHKMSWSEMTPEELSEFGVAMKNLEIALTNVYNQMHPETKDKVEIIYLIRMGESTLEVSESEQYHLHWHMIPRTPNMKEKGIAEWSIHKGRLKGLQAPTIEKIETIMELIRDSLTQMK